MKFTVPGLVLTAVIVAAPAAFAQNTGYSGSTSAPGASVAKDDQTNVTKRSKKHMASYKQRHHAKHTSSKPETTGSGKASAPGAGMNKDDTTPKSR